MGQGSELYVRMYLPINILFSSAGLQEKLFLNKINLS